MYTPGLKFAHMYVAGVKTKYRWCTFIFLDSMAAVKTQNNAVVFFHACLQDFVSLITCSVSFNPPIKDCLKVTSLLKCD